MKKMINVFSYPRITIMGNSASFDKRIEEQEMYVRSNFQNVKNQLNTDIKSYKYSDQQIKGKLREHFHGIRNNNNYILNNTWKNVKI